MDWEQAVVDLSPRDDVGLPRVSATWLASPARDKGPEWLTGAASCRLAAAGWAKATVSADSWRRRSGSSNRQRLVQADQALELSVDGCKDQHGPPGDVRSRDGSDLWTRAAEMPTSAWAGLKAAAAVFQLLGVG